MRSRFGTHGRLQQALTRAPLLVPPTGPQGTELKIIRRAPTETGTTVFTVAPFNTPLPVSIRCTVKTTGIWNRRWSGNTPEWVAVMAFRWPGFPVKSVGPGIITTLVCWGISVEFRRRLPSRVLRMKIRSWFRRPTGCLPPVSGCTDATRMGMACWGIPCCFRTSVWIFRPGFRVLPLRWGWLFR